MGANDWESRFEMTPMERKFFDAASKEIPDLIPQYEVCNGKYRLDFAKIIYDKTMGIPILQIAVELDDHSYHSSEEARTSDADRQRNLEREGWRFIRFTGSQVQDLPKCINDLKKFIEKRLNEISDEGKDVKSAFLAASIDRIPNLLQNYKACKDKYILDFALILKGINTNKEFLKLAIDLDSYPFIKGRKYRNYDSQKMRDLEHDGWQVIRFTGRQVQESPQKCVDEVLSRIEKFSLQPNLIGLKPDTLNAKRTGSLLEIDKKILDINAITLKKLLGAILIICMLWVAAGFLWDNEFLSKNKRPNISALAPNLSDNQVAGTKISWTATAYDPENDILLYRFSLNGPSTNYAWKALTDWIKTNSFTWNTTKSDIGENQIKVQIIDGNHSGIQGFDAEKIMSFAITGLLPVIKSLTPSRPSPQFAGTDISWKAAAYDPLERGIYYRFSISGPSTNEQRSFISSWTTNNRWIWRTKPSDEGTYQIYVEIRSENSVEPEIYRAVSFTLTNPPPEPPILESDKMSPQNFGTPIIWEAISSDPNGDTIYYRYLLSGPSTGFDWKVVHDWSTSDTWTWVPSALSVGDNAIKVQVRDAHYEDNEVFDAESDSTFTIIDPQQKQANLTIPPSIQKPAGYQHSAESNQLDTKKQQEVDQPSTGLNRSIQTKTEQFNKIISVGGDKKHNRTLYIGEVNKRRS
ncbi:MAG: DUF559 domain-containing protein [Methanotrichaceae archaeon]|nr:DUF559 domain-containing protein [Methanotrichaceae archaeon]